MRFGSICSGIEAASVAWGPLGWEAAWFAEIEPFPSAVLAHHYPYTLNVGDMTALPALIRSGAIEAPELLCGGTPCQAFSVAGKRQSLDDARGNLTLTFCDIADAIDEVRNDGSIIFWENVPGVLNTKDNAFGCFLGALAGESGPLEPAGSKWPNAGVVLGPKRAIAWRVLDAQYFGVAQRRRRVFVVASARDGFDPAAVLFEFEGVRRDSPPSREAGEGVADRSGTGAAVSSGNGWWSESDVGACLRAQDSVTKADTLIPQAFGGNNQSGPIDVATARNACASASGRMDFESETFLVQPTPAMQVRRLTPVECERLQGFPEIVKTCTITVSQNSNSNLCSSDQQSTNALAARQSHKSPSNASPAEENVFPSSVNAAEQNLNVSHIKSSAPVLVNVQIDLERQHLQLHSQGKLLLSASIADASEWCRLPIQVADFAQLSVALLAWLERTAPHGRGALHLNTSGSFPLLIGNWFASQSGREIEELANDAEKFMSAVKRCTTFITSEAGRSFQNCESNLQTLLCCVTAAISSFIPSEIRGASSYALSIEVSHGYTLIPWRNKPAEDCPDGPRYKALGNSWAVPVVRWVGCRIDAIASK